MSETGQPSNPPQSEEDPDRGARQRTWALAGALSEDVARALHLNIKKLPKRQKNWALSYDAYLRLAQAVVALLQLSGWRFERKARRVPHEGE